MVAVMRTGHKHKHPLEEGLEHINPIKAQLLNIFGPADGRGNPLNGTQYDPIVRQKIETERRHERWARQEERRHARRAARYSGVGAPWRRRQGTARRPARLGRHLLPGG
jgi:hypothetical protein